MHNDSMIIHLKSPQSGEQKPRAGMQRRPPLFFILLAAIMLAVLSIGFFSYMHFTSIGYERTLVDGEEAERLVASIGSLMLLPEEKPTIATVSDLSSLEGQTFFKNARLGDIVLMFSKAQRAILYNPSEHKIIEVAPITVGTE